jgi:hypothetical protein
MKAKGWRTRRGAPAASKVILLVELFSRRRIFAGNDNDVDIACL